jgi:hypothetical protein
LWSIRAFSNTARRFGECGPWLPCGGRCPSFTHDAAGDQLEQSRRAEAATEAAVCAPLSGQIRRAAGTGIGLFRCRATGSGQMECPCGRKHERAGGVEARVGRSTGEGGERGGHVRTERGDRSVADQQIAFQHGAGRIHAHERAGANEKAAQRNASMRSSTPASVPAKLRLAARRMVAHARRCQESRSRAAR